MYLDCKLRKMPNKKRAVPSSCCSTAIRSRSGPSTRCPRTSRPPTAPTRTPSTASPRCSSSCCRSSDPNLHRVLLRYGRSARAHRGVLRVQERPHRGPRHLRPPAPADPRGLEGDADPDLRAARPRGGRHHRLPRQAGRLPRGSTSGSSPATGTSFSSSNDDIKVLYNRRGITDIVEMDPKAVEERYGVPPTKYVDLKALEGDLRQPARRPRRRDEDGGEARAEVRYPPRRPSLTPTSRRPSWPQNLAAHAEQVAINKKLSTLAEVPLEGDVSDLVKMGAWDMDAVRELFSSLEFRSLARASAGRPSRGRRGRGDAVRAGHARRLLGGGARRAGGGPRRGGRFALDVSSPAPAKPPRSVALAWGEEQAAFIPLGPARRFHRGARTDSGPGALGPLHPKARGRRSGRPAVAACGRHQARRRELRCGDRRLSARPRRAPFSISTSRPQVRGPGAPDGRGRAAGGGRGGSAGARARSRRPRPALSPLV